MRSSERLTPREVKELMLGTNAVLLLEEGEYATYHRTYLMPPLSDVRAPRRRSADVPSSSSTRATNTPSTSRAGTSRSGAREIPPTYQYVGWLDLLTELTGWWYGTSYPIPLEPPLPDHRYVRDPDLPPSRVNPQYTRWEAADASASHQ